MFRIIRHKTPFIILAVFLIVTIWHNLEFYFLFDLDYDLYYQSNSPLKSSYMYIGELFSNSLMFNLFMLSVYMNKRYCDATKLCVLCLITINLLGLMGKDTFTYSFVYDLYICLGILAILIGYKMQPKRTIND